MSVPLKNNFSDTLEACMRKTAEIRSQYNHFLAQLESYMLVLQQDGTLDTSVVKNYITNYDSKLKVPMSHCKSLQNIFEIISSSKYSSFLNYDLIKLLVDFGNDKIKNDFTTYKRKLQIFLESRITEHCSGEGKSYAVVIDESITQDATNNMSQLQYQVQFILGHKNVTLLHWENLQPETKKMELQCENRIQCHEGDYTAQPWSHPQKNTLETNVSFNAPSEKELPKKNCRH